MVINYQIVNICIDKMVIKFIMEVDEVGLGINGYSVKS